MTKSDININTKVFDPDGASPSTKALNAYLLQHANDEGPKWWEVSKMAMPWQLVKLNFLL